ncbi:acetyl-CoA carboxylase, carboxyltransferase subunit beta [Raoultibacter phocaeensis]|uniref:acetyl-CoA carboxylase, carboxyltransferase subunit beta n=1 Tax=Raoultibacter phocaeensis TaxID=2479841 RepID=UPI0021049F2C|nr:acetyl-CoA carboxylase, carboxyltransferase subunit beta [Raoultibacter phocaeensis]
MGRRKRQDYITIPHQGIRPEWVQGVSTEELLAANGTNVGALGTVEIAYSLASIAQELERDRASAEKDARALRVVVAGYGENAKRTIRACLDAGLEAYAVYAGEDEQAAYVRAATGAEKIGETFSEALFCNSHALLSACDACGARAVLALDAALGTDQHFCGLAAARGIKVFRAITPSVPVRGWLVCEGTPLVRETAWKKCPHCGLMFDVATLVAGHYECPSCGGLYRMSSSERICDLFDAGSFEEWERGLPQTDPLDFPGYRDKLASACEQTGLDDAVRCGSGAIAGMRMAIAIMDARFFMGSMGSVVGEKIARTVERATRESLPLVIFTASGGARMQEGIVSLMQMAKVSCALSAHGEAGLLYVSVLTDPTTGGVTASFAMQGDIVLAEPGALVGFAGQRVIRDTIKQELPDGFQSAEFALEHGLIDAVVPRAELREKLAHIVAIHEASSRRCALEDGAVVSYAAVCENLSSEGGTYNTVTYGKLPQLRRAFTAASQRFIPAKPKQAKRSPFGRSKAQRASERRLATLLSGGFYAEDGMLFDEADEFGPAAEKRARTKDRSARASCANTPPASSDNRAWESVQLARNTKRPTAMAYVRGFVDGFIELHGDRSFADDGAVVGGIGWIGGHPVTVIVQEKGADLKERLARNFGCPQPEGYRKSLRLMRQAEKFGRSVVCIVDTQGALCGTEAEQRGAGNAIADNLLAMAGLRVPIVSVLVGEGGSGGALALALADRVAMQEHAVYSVLSPEGFASILWKDRTRAPEAAAVMKMSAREAHELGVVDAVLSEGQGPAHENPDVAIAVVRGYLVRALDELEGLPASQLVEARYARFRSL